MSDLTPENYRFYANSHRDLAVAFARVQDENKRLREEIANLKSEINEAYWEGRDDGLNA